MTIRSIRPLLCGGLLMLAVATPAIAPAEPVTGTCNPTTLKFSASALTDTSTMSGSFVNIPEASISFIHGGTKPSCIIVHFSAEATAHNMVIVRARLDNALTALPEEAIFAGADSSVLVRARSYDFIFPSVAPGHHALRMQFRTGDGEIADMTRYNTIVQLSLREWLRAESSNPFGKLGPRSQPWVFAYG